MYAGAGDFAGGAGAAGEGGDVPGGTERDGGFAEGVRGNNLN